MQVLSLLNAPPSVTDIAGLIFSADIIYVGGGDTELMLRTWSRFRVDMLLREAWDRGIILAGLSAGMICWFRYGGPAGDGGTGYVRGLGVLPGLACPHYDSEPARRRDLPELARDLDLPALALDDGAALFVEDQAYRIISSLPGARGWRAYWRGQDWVEDPLEPDEEGR